MNDRLTILNILKNDSRVRKKIERDMMYYGDLIMYRNPVPSRSDDFVVSTTFYNSGTSLSVSSTVAGNISVQTISAALTPPYSFKFDLEVGLYIQAVYISPMAFTSISRSAAYYNGPFNDCIAGYFDGGVYVAAGTVGVPANPTKLNSPVLVTSADVAGPAVRKVFGFREFSYGKLELYDQRTDTWLPVDSLFMGSFARRVHVHLGYNKTYSMNIRT